jgi:hypothetical protein
MTIAQRLLSFSFDRHGNRPEPGNCGPSSGITCAPWEGLYFPDDEPEVRDEASVPNAELDRFLYSLMSGE